jgi:DNA primase
MSSYIPDATADDIKVKSDARLIDVIGSYIPLKRQGASFVGKCPECGAKDKFNVTPAKGIFKCFVCDGLKGNNAVTFVMQFEKCTYPDAIRSLAQILDIYIDDGVQEPATRIKSKSKKKKTTSFCESFLTASGLTIDDVKVSNFIKDVNKTTTISNVFKSGTLHYGNVVPGDDVIIEYYDLEGLPVRYEELNEKGKPTGKLKEYLRVRYQFPDEHKDKNGHAVKYRSPRGSATFLYIPQKIREKYKSGENIDCLFIQEGEKKAEKACKHNIPSVGISGIQNLAYKGRLPEDLIRIIEKCKVREVVLLFDSDWNDISSSIKLNDNVEQRPRNFFYAAKNFRDYMRGLKNRNIYVQAYVGNIKKNDANDKGIDDLLTNTLKGNEDSLAEDIACLMNEKNLTGSYMQLHAVTSISDVKLEELWFLNDPALFANKHHSILKNIPEFRIGNHLWKFDDDDELISAQPLEKYEEYWTLNEKEVKGETRKTYEFCYVNSMNFLQNRGFGRLARLDGSDMFIHLDPPVVKQVTPGQIKDYVTGFTRDNRLLPVLEMLYRGGSQYLGPEKMGNLMHIYPNFEEPRRDQQLFYFKDTCWKINENDIKEIDYTSIDHHIWIDQRKNFPAVLIDEPIIKIIQDEDNHFDYEISNIGKKCHFLQFLINTSNFTWKKAKQNIAIDPIEFKENKDHLVSKLCAIGYMLMSYKDRSVSRAVVGMDGKQSEVGKSNGRSGKSIIGLLFQNIIPTAYIPGKGEIEKDQFTWTEVTEKTKTVFIDDVRVNFSLEWLFPAITGDWSVNYKGGGRITFPFAQSPKIYITTNHALNGEGSSFNDRQWKIAFSDFYNDEHKPKDDFGVLFFDEWDFDQWNLLWNLMAVCVQTYLKFGVIQAPADRLRDRQLRQLIGETFITWAEEYFSNESHLNGPIARKDIFSQHKKDLEGDISLKFLSPKIFKDKIKWYCELKGYIFNPQKYDPTTGLPYQVDKDGDPVLDDKSNGVEYFTIGEASHWKIAGKTIETDESTEEPNYKI